MRENIGKQDTRQLRQRNSLKSIGAQENTRLSTIVTKVATDLEYPLRIHASFPTPDSKLNFTDALIDKADGANQTVPPVKKQVFQNLSGLYIDFQTQMVSNPMDFDIEWPTPNVVGRFRRIGFSLIGSGKIKLLFSEEFLSQNLLPDAGSLFVKGSLPIGFIDVVCTNVAGYFKSATAVGNTIINSDIFRFGSGAGGGGGDGDANEILERLKNQLDLGFYDYVTPVIFSQDEESKTDSLTTTASYSIVDEGYLFDSGEVFRTIQMLDPEYLLPSGDLKDISKVRLEAFWDSLVGVDTNAIYEASRDGGVNFQPITVSRVGNSDAFFGEMTFVDEPTNPFSQVVGVTNTINTLTDLNTLNRIFTVTDATVIKNIVLDVTKTGTPLGKISVKIVKDVGGLPSTSSNDVIFESTPISVTGIITGALNVNCSAPLKAGSYHVVVSSDSAYKASYTIANKLDFAADATGITYTLQGRLLDLRIKITASTSNVLLKAMGVFYDVSLELPPIEGLVNRDVKEFQSIAQNLNTFTLNFQPDPKLMCVYEIGTGQVYRYGAFSLAGSIVTFPVNTFKKLTEQTVRLEFVQFIGSSYDNNDNNSALLASNHLGSPDLAIDMSVAGRGIFLRRPDGTLRELVINDNDEIEIYSV